MKITTTSTSFLMILFMPLFFPTLATQAYEILYSEDFQTGVISKDWRFYGDPISNINLEAGNPAPSFNNNGDSMEPSGIVLKRVFPIDEGICFKIDHYFSCHPRGTWVSVNIGLFNPNQEQQLNADRPPNYFGLYRLFYSGELDWTRPHLGVMLATDIRIDEILKNEDIHLDRFQNNWHTLTIELLPDTCLFFIDDSLISGYPVSLSDSLSQVGIYVGGRATSWGTALVDNLVVYRP